MSEKIGKEILKNLPKAEAGDFLISENSKGKKYKEGLKLHGAAKENLIENFKKKTEGKKADFSFKKSEKEEEKKEQEKVENPKYKEGNKEFRKKLGVLIKFILLMI